LWVKICFKIYHTTPNSTQWQVFFVIHIYTTFKNVSALQILTMTIFYVMYTTNFCMMSQIHKEL
jgi:hypothetical protein